MILSPSLSSNELLDIHFDLIFLLLYHKSNRFDLLSEFVLLLSVDRWLPILLFTGLDYDFVVSKTIDNLDSLLFNRLLCINSVPPLSVAKTTISPHVFVFVVLHCSALFKHLFRTLANFLRVSLVVVCDSSFSMFLNRRLTRSSFAFFH
jgi:hypothetical protein